MAQTVSELLADAERDGLRTRLEVDLDTEPPLELRGVIYRVIAKALANVRHHARAAAVEVCVEEIDGTVRARIRDDGIGFDPSAAPSGHIGLREMTDRIHAAGGEIEICSSPGQGAEIRFTVPVATRAIERPRERGLSVGGL